MKFLRKISSVIMVFILCLSSNCVAFGQQNTAEEYDINDAKNIVMQLFDYTNQRDWKNFSDLMCDDEKSYFEYYFTNDELTTGIKQVISADVIELYEVNNRDAKDEWLINEYPILETSEEVYSLVIEVDCLVSEENQFFYNGINYLLIILAKEENFLKIVQIDKPSVSLIEKAVKPMLDENGANYQKELNGIEVLDYAEKGLVVNAENDIITEGFKTISENRNTSDAVYSADPPVINHYSTYSYPTYINVKLDMTGNGEIKKLHLLIT